MPMYDAPNHTQIPNKFLDERMLKMSGSAVKVFLAIARKTFGWHKHELRDRISFSQLRKLSGVSSNETLYRCFEELKDDIEKEVIDGVTYFSISATASMQQYFGTVTEIVTPRYDNRHDAVTEIVNTKERVKELVAQAPKKSPEPYLDTNDNKWVNVTDDDVALWEKAYPACDIERELAKMAAWIIANPEKRKTKWRRFITNWLSRCQNNGGTR